MESKVRDAIKDEGLGMTSGTSERGIILKESICLRQERDGPRLPATMLLNDISKTVVESDRFYPYPPSHHMR